MKQQNPTHLGEQADLVHVDGTANWGVSGFEAVRRNAWIIALCAIAGLVLAFVMTKFQAPRYTATSSVQIDQQASPAEATDKDSYAPQVADAQRQLNTQVDILRSQAMARRVEGKLDLAAKPRFWSAMGEPSVNANGGPGANSRLRRRMAVEVLSDHLTISLPKDTRVARISLTSRDPVLSAVIANSYARNLVDANSERRFRGTDYARAYLGGQLVDARSRLEASERALNAYARGAALVNTDDAAGRDARTPGSVTQSTLLQVNQALSNAQARRIEAEQKLRAAQSSQLLALPEVVGNPAIQRLMSERAAQEVSVAEARSRYTGEHPTVLAAEARANRLDGEIGSIAANLRTSLQTQYRAAAGEEAALANQVARVKAQSLAEQDRSVRYNTLKHEVDTNRLMYDSLLQRQREVSSAAGLNTNNISVLDEAEAPMQPSSPNPLLNAVAGVVIGLMVGIALAMLREVTDERVNTADALERKLGLRSLGEIPLLRGVNGKALLSALGDPTSDINAAYTAFRTSLLFSTANGLPRNVLITSSSLGEGKTTAAIATASSLANAGKRVLLIDADMRQRGISELLDLGDADGLSSLLTRQAELRDVIVDRSRLGFDFIPAGPTPPGPSDILDFGTLRAMLDEVATSYDCAIIDSPGAAQFADASLLGAVADCVVFVASAQANHRGRAKSALRRLSNTGATILGGLVNKGQGGLSAAYRPNFLTRGSTVVYDDHLRAA
jgi:capsular exopolysaccharide synthesis family protein